MRTALGLLLTLAPNDALSRLVEQLGDSDIALRDQATRELLRIGLPAWEALEKAAREPDVEAAARSRMLLEELNPLKAVLPLDERGTVPQDQTSRINVRIRNREPGDAIFCTKGFSAVVTLLEVHDSGRPTYGGYLSGQRLLYPQCLLSDSDFESVAPGGERDRSLWSLTRGIVEIPPTVREQHPDIDLDWTGLRLAGRYRLVARYAYDPAEYKSRCPNDCAAHEEPDRPWNRASTRPLEVKVDFVVRSDGR